MLSHTPLSVRRAFGTAATLVSVLVSVGLPFGLAGCNKVPLLAPSGATITFTASAAVLPLNGTTQLFATVVTGSTTSGTGAAATTSGGGTPVEDGTEVSFTTTLGTIQPATAKTVGGAVTVTLNAGGQSGTATITAYSGGVSKVLAPAVIIGATNATKIVLSSSPETLPASGGTAVVSAVVLDKDGNGVPGVSVSFSASVGTLSAAAATTDKTGTASVTLTTTRAASVSAAVGSVAATALAVAVNPLTTLLITPPTTAVSSVPVSITVAPTVPTGGLPISLVVLNFGDGTSTSLGAIQGSTAVQHIFGGAATYLLTATATNSDGSQISVSTNLVVTPLQLNASVSPTSGTIGSPFTFTASFPTGTGSPSIDHYAWNFGDGTNATTSGPQVFHSFSNSGTFTMVVVAVPTVGPSASAQVNATVTPLSITNVQASPNTAPHGTTVAFTVTVPNGSPIDRYDWDFGDGGTATTSSLTITHVFAAAGVYTVKVTGTVTSTGVTASSTLVIIIT